MTDDNATANKQYTVVLRCAESAIRIAQGRGILVSPIATPFGNYDLKIVTRTEKVAAFDTPLPRELWIEVSGRAPSMQDAVRLAYSIADEYVRIAAFATNAWQGILEFHIGFDSSAAETKREFHQNWVFDEQGLVRPARNIDPDVTLALMEAIAKMDPRDRNRIVRAVYMYTDALQYWKQGGEIHALAYTYMGVEAITPLVVMREVQRRGLKDRNALDEKLHGAPADSLRLRLATWLFVKAGGQRSSQLDAWIRREIIFKGDANTYKTAKGASDKWEHATDDRGRIHGLAATSLEKTAFYLRSAILDLLPLSDANRMALQSGEFTKPASTLGFQRWVSGVLNCSGDDLAAPDQAYPIVRWEFSMRGLTIGEGGRYEMTVNQKISPKLAAGVSFTLERLHFSGPVPMQHSNVEVSIQRAERVVVDGVTGARMEIEVDAPENAKWVHPYGSVMLNSNVFHPFTEFWLGNILGLVLDSGVRPGIRANVDRIQATLASRNVPADLIERCRVAWDEAVDIDEVREILALARTTPEGLTMDTRSRAGMQQLSVIGDVAKLVEMNERVIASARKIISLSEELGHALSVPPN